MYICMYLAFPCHPDWAQCWASMGVTSRSTFPVPEFRVVLHIGRILHRAWAAAYKCSEESSAELSGMKSVNEHTALLSFLEKTR